MKSNFIYLFFITASTLLFACNQSKTNKSHITKRIQYDVNIVSPGQDYEWYIQNIEGQDREKFIKKILNEAYDGNVKAYDFFSLEEITPEKVKSIGNSTDSTVVQNSEAPYEFKDTVIQETLELHEITRVRFLEEWVWDDGLEIEKEVIGICPLLNNYDPQGNFRGYQPMFWVFFDKRYPAELKL